MREKWLTLFRHLFWSVEGMDWMQQRRKDKSLLCLRFHSYAPSSQPSDLDDEKDTDPLVLFLSLELHSQAPGSFSTDTLSQFFYKPHCILRFYLNIKHDIPLGALGKIRAWRRLSEACSLTGCGLFFLSHLTSTTPSQNAEETRAPLSLSLMNLRECLCV